MPTINQLSQATTLTGSDQIPIYSSQNGDARKASLSSVLAYVEANFASPDYVTQYASPNVNGTNVQVSSTTAPTWLVLTPTASFAAMTITLPLAAQLADGTELLVFCSQGVTTLTIATNGALAVYGAPTSILANSSFLLRFNAASQSWFIASSAVGAVSGTWTPVATLAVPSVGAVTYAGRYTVVGNVVTLELGINQPNPSTFTFTSASDYFTGLPTAIMPSTTAWPVASPPVEGWQMFIGYDTGALQWRAVFAKSGSPSFTDAVPPHVAGARRWTVSYLL